MSTGRSNVRSMVALGLSVVVFAVAAVLAWRATGGFLYGREPDQAESRPAELVSRSFDQYSWDELSQISQMIAEAPTDEEGLRIARSFNLAQDGSDVPVYSTRDVRLANGLRATVRIVGFRRDAREDGSVAGMTLMLSSLASQPMDETGTSVGWRDSGLRVWLSATGLGLLPSDLSAVIVPVTKQTNNTGKTDDASMVTTTVDALWPFSVREVCGEVSWFLEEYGNEYVGGQSSAVYDAILNAEGTQYPYFSASGVAGKNDPNGALELLYGDAPTSWWYRTPYPFEFAPGTQGSYFYQVMASGYPSSVGDASQPAGVVVGFCI